MMLAIREGSEGFDSLKFGGEVGVLGGRGEEGGDGGVLAVRGLERRKRAAALDTILLLGRYSALKRES